MFLKKYQKKNKKQDKSKKVKVFLALTKDLALLTLYLAPSNCNTGISFHSVMQNIFITFEAEICHNIHIHEIPFITLHERADFQYFIDLRTIIRAKREAKIQKFIHTHKLKHFILK